MPTRPSFPRPPRGAPATVPTGGPLVPRALLGTAPLKLFLQGLQQVSVLPRSDRPRSLLLTKPRLSPRSNRPICSFCSFETLPVSAPRARPQSRSSPAPGSLVPLVLPVVRAHGHSWACWAVTGPLCHQASPSTRLLELSSLGHLLGLLSQCWRLILVTEFSPSLITQEHIFLLPRDIKKKKSGHILKI